jgi:hypothetical protein
MCASDGQLFSAELHATEQGYKRSGWMWQRKSFQPYCAFPGLCYSEAVVEGQQTGMQLHSCTLHGRFSEM